MTVMNIAGNDAEAEEFDAVVVGAGFAGLYLLIRLRELGLSAIGLEAAPDVGGTWYWNIYPGCRCDVESLQYSFSFDENLQQEWKWSERYAAQPEILAYARHVADRYDLRKDIRFETRVVAATFDGMEHRWTVETDRGEVLKARFVIMATGVVSIPHLPDIEGLSDYKGRILHTGAWPREEVDFTGMRVGVIGTGSSGVQVIPEIAKQASRLCVFQRTATYTIPAHNGPLDPAEDQRVKARYPEFRREMLTKRGGVHVNTHAPSAMGVSAEERERVFEDRWSGAGPFGFLQSFGDLVRNEASNRAAAEFVRSKIRQTVKDPEVARKLTPKQYFGVKRLCADTDYYKTYNRPNVDLIDLRETPIKRFTAEGVRSKEQDIALDAVVFATGFDAITGSMLRIRITGDSGLTLNEKWTDGPCSYLGLMAKGFPNMFFVTGPGSPSVLSNVLLSIEHHVRWISNCIDTLRKTGKTRIEPTLRAETEWTDHVHALADETLYIKGDSWYIGANIPGKPRVFSIYLGGVPAYQSRCDQIATAGYEGFALS